MSDDLNNPDLAPPGAPTKKRIGWRGLFIGSLALNLFLAGVLGVWAMRPYLHRPPPPPQQGGNVADRMANWFPDADRPVLRQAFTKRQGELDRLFEEARRAQRDARAALRTEPFDVAAFDAATERERAARSALQGVLQAATREAALGMSAEGREKLMQRGRQPADENRRRPNP